MKTLFRLTIFAGIVFLLFSSCSSKRLLPDATSNNAKNLSVIEDKAIVYVYRRSVYGAAVSLSVDLNNRHLADFYAKRFYLCILDPGRYVFTGRCENTDDLILNLEAGKKYYIEVTPQTGWLAARCKLSLSDPREGKRKVQQCRLIGLNEEAQKVLNYSPLD